MKLNYRMYHLVMYSLSPIQQGIQCYHAGIEYALKYGKDKDFLKWAKIDKTVILLNGGTSVTMQNHHLELNALGVKHSIFCEPDLNHSVSAIALLVDERVYDKEKYPDEDDWCMGESACKYADDVAVEDAYYKFIGGDYVIELRKWLSQFRLA